MEITRVVNLKNEPFDVYIGRPSKFGNPYSHKEGTAAQFKVSSRKEAVEKYEEYLIQNVELMKSLVELKGKTLGCWCHPQLCHGDILSKWANSIGNELF